MSQGDQKDWKDSSDSNDTVTQLILPYKIRWIRDSSHIPLLSLELVTIIFLFQGKMQSENLLRTECGGGYDSDDGAGGGLRGSGGHQYSGYHHQYNVQL